MKVSVVMPLYNGEKYLSETLASISRQTHLPDEVIVSDDGSQDRTLQIVADWAKTIPFAVKIVKHTRSGITNNYLNALKEAHGDIIIFSDQDDIWLENKIGVGA